MQLGRVGVWNSNDRLSPAELARLLKVPEELGYGAPWYPEAVGYEAFSSASFMLAHSSTRKIGSSIAKYLCPRRVHRAQRAVQGRCRRRAYPDRVQHGEGGAGEWPVMLAARGRVIAVKLQIRAHFDAGATQVCLRPVHPDGDHAARDRMLRAMADR